MSATITWYTTYQTKVDIHVGTCIQCNWYTYTQHHTMRQVYTYTYLRSEIIMRAAGTPNAKAKQFSVPRHCTWPTGMAKSQLEYTYFIKHKVGVVLVEKAHTYVHKIAGGFPKPLE